MFFSSPPVETIMKQARFYTSRDFCKNKLARCFCGPKEREITKEFHKEVMKINEGEAIPTGLRHIAQGCGEDATLGVINNTSLPRRGCEKVCKTNESLHPDATPVG